MNKDEFYVATTLFIMFISFCALGFTIYQGRLTRIHNRKSIMPALCSWRYNLHNGDKSIFKYVLHNKGHGTASITNYAFYFRGKEVTYTIFEDTLHDRIDVFGTKAEVLIARLTSGGYIEKSEKFTMIEINFDNLVDKAKLRKFIEDFAVVIDYASFYGETNEYKSDWLNS